MVEVKNSSVSLSDGDMRNKPRANILSGYKKERKIFIPPLLHMLKRFSGLKEISYRKSGIPEVIWIGLLNHKVGVVRGAEIDAEIAKIANVFPSSIQHEDTTRS